jgi:beta-N-acetylhexosaminidase
MKLRSRFFLAWLVVAMAVLLPGRSAPGLASPPIQENAARVKAQNLLQKMTPEERVGQLFMVTLTGNSFDSTSQIYDLITQHHVGGVMLLRANDNFGGAEGTLLQTYQLNKALQDAEQAGAQNLVRDPVSGVSYTPNYVPLFIGISQEGDLYPNDQIISGMTPLPDLMSIGATWDPSVAQQVGAVMGQELSTLGFNLYLGPSLDVLDTPQMDNGEDLGVRTFGGDPYWVGKMGEAYIAGVHQGSNNHMAVIAKNFPGRGSSDRSPEEEIATVRKSLEQLKQIELAPFFAVTGNAPTPEMITDGLLVSHIRYQGFQGNIRSTTRPVSSDATAMEQILQVTDSAGKQPFVTWRSNGGVMVSDNLGSEAVRKFYDPTGSGFDARTAAREAFFAGNDLLYVDRFIGTNDPDAYTTIVRTMEFFAQKYREDNAFAQRVDASVERILTLKYRLYPDFQSQDVVPSQDGLLVLGKSQQVTFDVARRSVTLISPSATDLPTTLAQPPAARERVLFLTDVQVGRQCSSCQDEVALTVDALQSTVLRLYGPRGSGQVSASLMASYPFSDLLRYLNGNADMATMETDIRMSDWIVVSLLKPNSGQPETGAFRRLLNERPDLLRNKKIIVFAFNAPYYLDATDISKLTAYYGMYSKSPAFVDVAARVLFQELMPTGLLPVSVPGVGYDLIQATSPDPNQSIPLSIDQPVLTEITPTGTPEPTKPKPVHSPVHRPAGADGNNANRHP